MQVQKRTKLTLSAPQVSESELEEVNKMQERGAMLGLREQGCDLLCHRDAWRYGWRGSHTHTHGQLRHADTVLRGACQSRPQCGECGAVQGSSGQTPLRTPKGDGDSLMKEAQDILAMQKSKPVSEGGAYTLHNEKFGKEGETTRSEWLSAHLCFQGATPQHKKIETPNPMAGMTPGMTPRGGKVGMTPGSTPGGKLARPLNAPPSRHQWSESFDDRCNGPHSSSG